jgi:hypothetical protein
MPYDASPAARATLCRVATVVRTSGGQYGGVILATAGIDPCALDALVSDAQHVAGPDVALEVRLLNAGDPLLSLRQLAASLPDAVFAAPLGAAGHAPWYADACTIDEGGHTLMLFFLAPKEIARFTEVADERHRMGGPLGAVLRACAGLHLGRRAPVGKGAA